MQKLTLQPHLTPRIFLGAEEKVPAQKRSKTILMTLIFGISLLEINWIFLLHFAIYFSVTSDGEDLPLYKKNPFRHNFLRVKYYSPPPCFLHIHDHFALVNCDGANFFSHLVIFCGIVELTLRNFLFKHYLVCEIVKWLWGQHWTDLSKNCVGSLELNMNWSCRVVTIFKNTVNGIIRIFPFCGWRKLWIIVL